MKDRLRIAVSGASGFVGSTIFNNGFLSEHDVLKPHRNELDVTKIDQVRRFIEENQTRCFVHAAAYTDVQKAKNNFGEVKRINGLGTENAARVCEEFGIRMVLLSSDFIFPGTLRNQGRYKENAPRPESFSSISLGYYGSSKLLSEQVAEQNCSKLSVVRISYPYGGSDFKKDYVCKLINNVRLGRGVFSDQRITPTYLPDLKEALTRIVDLDVDGIFHVSSVNETTPYEMAKYVVEKLGLDLEVKEGSFVNYYAANPNVDIVPQYGGLDNKRTREKLGLEFHTWQSGVDEQLEGLVYLL